MTAPTIGFQFDTTELESLVPSKAEMSVVGAVVTAPAKQGGVSLNVPISVNTDDVSFYTALGVTGTAQQTIRGIAKQMGQMSKSARMVVVVVAEGVSETPATKITQTIANMVGDPVTKTGVHAFRKAGQLVNRIPRILIGPGYTSQQVGSAANALCTELAVVAESLLAVCPVTGPATTLQAALDWRETLASKRLIPTETDVTVIDSDGDNIIVPSDAYVAGLMNMVDELHGGYPFHSAGNRTLQGVVGPSRSIDFSLTDGDTEGQELLENNMGIIIRGEGGDDFALAEGGTLYLGVGTASNESLWQYYNQVRGRDWIHLTTLRTLRELLARYNLNSRLVQTLVNTMRTILLGLAADERIHRDFAVNLLPSLNAPADLRAGQLSIKMAVEEPAPFMRGIIKSSRYEFALTNFIENLEAQINTVAL